MDRVTADARSMRTTIDSHSHVDSQALSEVHHRLVDVFIDREFEFYDFLFLKFNEFYEFFSFLKFNEFY